MRIGGVVQRQTEELAVAMVKFVVTMARADSLFWAVFCRSRSIRVMVVVARAMATEAEVQGGITKPTELEAIVVGKELEVILREEVATPGKT